MDLGLTGKRALVLGATRGLGRGIAEALAAEGAHLAITGRRLDDARRAAEEVAAAFGAAVHGLAFDTATSESGALVAAAREALGDVDIILLNGGGPPPGPVSETNAEVWRRQFEAQFLSFVELASAFLPSMRGRGWGRILVSSSSGAIQPIPNLGISNSLRGALLGWAKTLAAEVAADGVTVNTIVPGRIQTARLDEIDVDTATRSGRSIDDIKAASRASIPAGRYGTVAEYSAVAAFLVSDKAGYITGATIRVDGGMIRSI